MEKMELNQQLEKSIDILKLEESIDITNDVSLYLKNLGGRLPHNHINIIPVLMSNLDNCQVYFEIGTYHGGSMISAMRFDKNKKCQFYALDFFGKSETEEWNLSNGRPNQCELDGLTIEKVYSNIKNANIYNQSFELIKGDSQSISTIKLINERFNNTVDILFIDGDHSFNGVYSDFNNYKSLVKSGGYIIFDDYGWLEDVRKAVNYIITQHPLINVEDEFEIIGRLQLVERNDFIRDLDERLNASFILKKK